MNVDLNYYLLTELWTSLWEVWTCTGLGCVVEVMEESASLKTKNAVVSFHNVLLMQIGIFYFLLLCIICIIDSALWIVQ